MTSIFSDSWIGLVFEGRNKEYGAYDLRRRSVRNAGIAVLVSISLFAFALTLPMILKALSSEDDEAAKVKIAIDVELLAPPPIDPNEPPPPPVEPPPPLKTTIKFTPPTIVKDEEVTEEDEPPAQDEFEEADAGATTEQGDTSGVDLSLLDGSGEDVIGDQIDQVFTVVEQMPEFPGGEMALLKYLGSIPYPAIAKENDIEGSVYIRFVIEKSGNVSTVEVAKGSDKILNEAAIAHVKKMPPWKAGKQNGKEVKVQYIVPIKFILQ
ncbi:MAG: energy transducer TonB [Chitinophagales bacterium]|nr:energy transducer TonB [Chitinophagales bacterium]